VEVPQPSLVLERFYSVTKKFPREETYSLIDQMRRAAASVGMNLRSQFEIQAGRKADV
jgi:four helix bundle protein